VEFEAENLQLNSLWKQLLEAWRWNFGVMVVSDRLLKVWNGDITGPSGGVLKKQGRFIRRRVHFSSRGFLMDTMQ
jgi:hypothetical protein